MNSFSNGFSLLEEQKKINEELMGQMRQMQMQMKMMSSSMGGGGGGGNMGSMGGGMGNSQPSANGVWDRAPSNMGNSSMSMGGGGGMGSGGGGSMGGMGSGMGGMSNGGGGSMGSGFMSGGYGNMGSGYGDNYGGGKMGGFSSNQGMGMNRSVPYNMRIPKEPGDWDCPACGNMNFARRTTCNGKAGRCEVEKRPEFIRRGVEQKANNTGGFSRRPGDWDCTKCGNLNYARRDKCNKCEAERGVAARPNPMQSMNRNPLIKPNGDWDCPKCNNMNYARRTQCNKPDCDFEKKDLDDYASRMGMGMGPGPMGGGMGMGGMGMGMGGMGNGMGGGMGGGMGPMGGGMGGMGGGMGPGPMNDMGGRPMSGRRKAGPEPRVGDWECPRCYNLNFSSRTKCNGTKGNEACALRKPEFEKYLVPLIKNTANIKEGDWDCWRCSNVNFATRDACNKCKADKEEAQDESLRRDYDEKRDSE